MAPELQGLALSTAPGTREMQDLESISGRNTATMPSRAPAPEPTGDILHVEWIMAQHPCPNLVDHELSGRRRDLVAVMEAGVSAWVRAPSRWR